MSVPAPDIVTCKQWGARPPKHTPQLTGRPNKIIEHHTDGHAAMKHAGAGGRMLDAYEYARALQNFHMDTNGWSDTGQSFTVMQSGIILQGRWGTVTAIERGRMVISAHCPGQNDQPGIEHEHVPGEHFTMAQLAATIALQAWICDRTGIRPTELYGHGHFYNTECPSNLNAEIPGLRSKVADYINHHGRGNPRNGWRFASERAVRAEISA